MSGEDAAGASGRGGVLTLRDASAATSVVHLTPLQDFLLPLRLFRIVQTQVVLDLEDLPTHSRRQVHLCVQDIVNRVAATCK